MPLPDPFLALGFAFNPLNRHSEKRDDEAFIERLYRDPSTRFVVFSTDVPLLKASNGHDALFSADEAARFGEPVQTVFLGQETDGEHEGRALFALGFEKDAIEAPAPPADVEPIDLRSIAMRGLVAPALVGALGQAKSMLDWHRRHRFCANCGQPSRAAAAGWRRHCDACGTQHFPRVDPVVIMLAIDGERCLLGRQRQFAPGMYSALAGFVEPGETAADAVVREVLEEAGVRCSGVTQFATQPWPFPSSLMIGCFAHADDTQIVVDTVELEDARWFSRAEVASMLDGTHPDGLTAPKPFAIAHHLLRAFADRGTAVLGH
ncbi:NAD(+) diphosphatase [Caballeronia telluris]|uniref:NAD(+) diphosphatase n=1 Tax=Caballeronia telluris TaxID=326475 RepID=A0A158EXU6_9BURK|nr:NAD(+) diphosphatase [Caballeronia telluris]SAL12381.1 NUDIX hydrolase [Caballeronia telluris]